MLPGGFAGTDATGAKACASANRGSCTTARSERDDLGIAVEHHGRAEFSAAVECDQRDKLQRAMDDGGDNGGASVGLTTDDDQLHGHVRRSRRLGERFSNRDGCAAASSTDSGAHARTGAAGTT